MAALEEREFRRVVDVTLAAQRAEAEEVRQTGQCCRCCLRTHGRQDACDEACISMLRSEWAAPPLGPYWGPSLLLRCNSPPPTPWVLTENPRLACPGGCDPPTQAERRRALNNEHRRDVLAQAQGVAERARLERAAALEEGARLRQAAAAERARLEAVKARKLAALEAARVPPIYRAALERVQPGVPRRFAQQ
jgi:hypothetical protein